MFLPAALLAALLAPAAPTARAQTTAPAAVTLQPMTVATMADALARPLGAAVSTPRTRGTLDLKGKRFYIAEYRVLIDQSGERPAWLRDGRLLGLQLQGDTVMLSYRSQPDIAALQALTDRAWADLQQRLENAGVTLTAPEEIIGAHGAIFEATEPGSTAAAPVTVDARTGDTTRHYLALAPSGGKLVRQVPGGLDIGNLAARLSYPRHNVEALSLALAVNLSALDGSGQRASSYALAPGVEALSPQMELGPAPSAALVHAHAQRALVNLNEALLLAPEFGRLRLASAAEAAKPTSPLQALITLGKSLARGPQTTLDTVLELDGPATGRLLMYSLQAANQAIADTLKAALSP
jgi:hypothetical protein